MPTKFQPVQTSHTTHPNSIVYKDSDLPLPQINCWTTTGNTKDKSTSSAGLNRSSSPLPWMYSEGNLALDKAEPPNGSDQ